MANVQRILGALMATGLGGRSRRGAGFGRAGSGGGLLGGLAGGLGGGARGGGLSRGAGLASLGMLAYQAYQKYQANQQQAGQQVGQQPAQPTDAGASVAAAEMDDGRAHLLVRAMIAAANADGTIDPEERQRIMGKLEEAGADGEDRDFIEQEMRSPVPLDTLLRQVDSPETAEQFYLASQLAIDADTAAEQSYLRYLADRLQLDPKRAEELRQAAG